MAGKADRHLRAGTLSEDLGILILSSFCAVAPVPRPQDVGIDVICTLLRPEGARNLYAEESFYVQVKSSSIEEVEFVDEKYEWFKKLQLPYFLALVNKTTCTVELYTAAMAKISFIEAEYRGIHFAIKPSTPQPMSRSEIRLTTFGPPLMIIDVRDIADKAKLDKYYQILKAVISIEEENRRRLRLRTMKRLKWTPNEVPIPDGQMSLVNVSNEKYEREVFEVLIETVKFSMGGFIRDPAVLDSIIPILEHAHRKEFLAKEDQEVLGLMFRVFSAFEGISSKK